MFCQNCGKEINDNAVVCVGCGVQQKPLVPNTPNVQKIKKLSGFQIAAIALFCLQFFAFLGYFFQSRLAQNFSFGQIFAQAIGFSAFVIIGLVLLFLDYKKRHKNLSQQNPSTNQSETQQNEQLTDNVQNTGKEYSVSLKLLGFMLIIIVAIVSIVAVIIYIVDSI